MVDHLLVDMFAVLTFQFPFFLCKNTLKVEHLNNVAIRISTNPFSSSIKIIPLYTHSLKLYSHVAHSCSLAIEILKVFSQAREMSQTEAKYFYLKALT